METGLFKISSKVECLVPTLEEYWNLLIKNLGADKSKWTGLRYQVSEENKLVICNENINELQLFKYKNKESFFCVVPFEEALVKQRNITTKKDHRRGLSLFYEINIYNPSNICWINVKYYKERFMKDSVEGRFKVIMDKDLNVISHYLPFEDEMGAYKWKKKWLIQEGIKHPSSREIKRLNELFFNYNKKVLSVFNADKFKYKNLSLDEVNKISNLSLPKNLATKVNLSSLPVRLYNLRIPDKHNFITIHFKDLSSHRIDINPFRIKIVEDRKDASELVSISKKILMDNESAEFINIGVYFNYDRECLITAINRNDLR